MADPRDNPKLIQPERPQKELYDLATLLDKHLGSGDRLLLADLLYESVTLDQREQVHQNAMAEVTRRAREVDEGKVELIPWEEVKRGIESRLKRIRENTE